MEKNWVKKFLWDYMIVQFQVTLSIGVVGTLFARDVTIDFRYFFLPLVLGVIYMLPCLPLYFKEDMTVIQVWLQRVVELILIEAGTQWAVRLVFDDRMPKFVYVALIFSVLIFDILTYVIRDYLEIKEVDELNEKLSSMTVEE